MDSWPMNLAYPCIYYMKYTIMVKGTLSTDIPGKNLSL